MRALKALVIIMGIMIALGVVVVGVTIYRRAMAPAPESVAKPAVPTLPLATGTTGGQALPGFGVRDLDLPPGSTIVSVQPMESRVLVHARLPDGGARILLLDPASGALAGEWRAPAGGAAAPP